MFISLSGCDFISKREMGAISFLVSKSEPLSLPAVLSRKASSALSFLTCFLLSISLTSKMDTDIIKLYFRYYHDPDQIISLEVPTDILVDDLRPILHDTEGLECSISQLILFSPEGEHIDHDATVYDIVSEIYESQELAVTDPLFIKILDPEELEESGDNMWRISSRINKLHIK
jgi:hypothetical protein